jgi:hypothetical protein
MLARFGVGAAVAALPAAAAITGAASGWSPWVIAVCTLLALFAVLVVPPAPYLRLLNRVPLIGSPKFEIVLRLNGRRDMRVRIDDWSNTSVLEVGILNRGRSAPVRDAWMNLLIPSGIRMGRCDKVGVAVEDAHRLRGRLPDRRLPGDGAALAPSPAAARDQAAGRRDPVPRGRDRGPAGGVGDDRTRSCHAPRRPPPSG